MEFDILKAGGILIKDKKLLVCRTKGREHFIAPGGKVEDGEDVLDALIRELIEEVGVKVAKEDIDKFGTFYANAAGHETVKLRMDVFTVSKWDGEPEARAEVEEIRWVDSEASKDLKMGSIFEHEVVPRLKASQLIN